MNTEQAPINTEFGFNSTALQVIEGCDLRGKTAIVTGGHSGIGLETTRALASAGATVVVGARNLEKAKQNVAGIKNVEVYALDLASPASIDAFTAQFMQSNRALDILINNAGIFGPTEVRDSRGYDAQFATNHLGHFQLVANVWPALKKSGNARVVALSSIGHMTGGVDFNDLHFEGKAYEKNQAYGQSKSAIALFALQLDKLGRQHGVRAFSVHPGSIMTELARNMSDAELALWGIHRGADGKFIPPAGFKTIEQGAATTVWCATSPQLNGKGGVYCEDCNVALAVPADFAGMNGVRPWAMDGLAAERLWNISHDLAGVPHETIG